MIVTPTAAGSFVNSRHAVSTGAGEAGSLGSQAASYLYLSGAAC